MRAYLRRLPRADRVALAENLTATEVYGLLHDWTVWAREKQLPPPGSWFVWMLRAGRGFGKTRTGAQWVHRRMMAGDERREAILISKTPADARDDMIEGPGGILRNVPPKEKPEYEPSKRRLTWPSGATARVRSGADPEGIRGFSGDTAWCDELAAWDYPREAWDNLMLGMREAAVGEPKVLVSTTPKPLTLLREIEKMSGTRVVTGSTHENRANLSDVFFREVIAPMMGTTKGRQEIEAELLDEMPGALWRRDDLDAGRRRRATDLVRIAVAVDPTTSDEATAAENDACGIVAGGVDSRNPKHGYVLADATLHAGPKRWGQRVVSLYHRLGANFVVAEGNNGGALVREVIEGIDRSVPVRIVKASVGKAARAEPVAMRYERLEVHHVTEHDGEPVDLAALEDELCTWVPGDGPSPNRLDANVWLWKALLIDRASTGTRATTF